VVRKRLSSPFPVFSYVVVGEMGKREKWGIDKKENEAPYSLLPRYNINIHFCFL